MQCLYIYDYRCDCLQKSSFLINSTPYNKISQFELIILGVFHSTEKWSTFNIIDIEISLEMKL